MIRFRSFLWLLALVALSVPPTGSWATTSAPMEHAAMTDCGEHKPPPPDDCPSRDTAKHATGECCPSMSGGIAVLPDAMTATAARVHGPSQASPARDLAGLDLAKEPPPPRV